ncbi:hypothetical protein B9T27_07885 [Acinetobacter sp. ANC 4648]|nr:hypothetical protein [Acinetobacter sp. ANC 4648]OTG82164.1 hypothetical protein B9T27_07885 [Acinetobacter sp. ANC 4648]
MAKVSKTKAEKAKPKSAGLLTEVAVENLAFAMGRSADIDEVLKQAGVSRQRLSVLLFDDEISQAMETRQRSFNVIFNHQDKAIEAQPVLEHPTVSEDDLYNVTLRFLEISDAD